MEFQFGRSGSCPIQRLYSSRATRWLERRSARAWRSSATDICDSRTSDFLITGVLTSGLRSAVAGSGSESNRWTRSFDSSSTGNRSCAKADVPQKTPPESKVVETAVKNKRRTFMKLHTASGGTELGTIKAGIGQLPRRAARRPPIADQVVHHRYRSCRLFRSCSPFCGPDTSWPDARAIPATACGPTKNARPIERASCLPNSRSVKRQASS